LKCSSLGTCFESYDVELYSLFDKAKIVVASSATITKGSGSEGDRTDGQVASGVFVSTRDPLTQAETSPSPGASVLDVMLSGHASIVDRGNACGPLAGCFQDVSFVTPVLRIFASYCFALDSRLFFDRLIL
jgi:hypothetical protein